LAAGITNLGNSEAKALDIDPLLTNSNNNQPPQSPKAPLELESQYPPLDGSLIDRYIYPPSSPLLPIQREVS